MENRSDSKLPLITDFALRAKPHIKFSIADADPDWAKLPKEQRRKLEQEIEQSGLFLCFGKNDKNLFMLKDSVRHELIATGSYENYISSRKDIGEMDEQERAQAGLRDQEDNILRADDESRGRKKRSDKAIMLIGIAILIAALALAKILLGKIAKP